MLKGMLMMNNQNEKEVHSIIEPIKWKDEKLFVLDQRKIPIEEVYVEVKDEIDVFCAIKDMLVRGAPLIGFTAIWGVVVWFRNQLKSNNVFYIDNFLKVSRYIASARPTAVNLAYEITRVEDIVQTLANDCIDMREIYLRLIDHVNFQMSKLEKDNMKMAELARLRLEKIHGVKKYIIQTICNTGNLACGPMGTALGAIVNLHEKNLLERVFVSETRPYLQGSRLTSYELKKRNIPHDIIVEGAYSYIFNKYKIDAVFAGADRIAANGDTANKIGTSTLSIVAKKYQVPFFIVAPTSSFDLSIPSGKNIEIELRDPNEILYCMNNQIAPIGVSAINPSFDVTENENITSIFCESGEIHPVNKEMVSSIAKKNCEIENDCQEGTFKPKGNYQTCCD